jgi:hypothetical protein
MRLALLVLILTIGSLAGSMGAGAEFNCFQTPGEGIRCACMGASDCSEMKNAGSCKSEAESDKGELGAVVRSAKRHALQRQIIGGSDVNSLSDTGPLSLTSAGMARTLGKS